MIAFAHPISVLMQAPEKVVSLTTSQRICGSGIFFIVAYNLLSYFPRVCDSKSPLLFVLVACIVNIFEIYFWLQGSSWMPPAQLATVFAQAVSVVCDRHPKVEKEPLFHQKSDLCFNSQCKRFLGIGLPLALQEFLPRCPSWHFVHL